MSKKRGNGEGGITRHKKSSLYMARYTVQSPTGTKRKTIYGKEREEVAEKLIEALSNRNKGLVFEGEDQTLSAYLDRWLNGSVKGSVKPSTYESYERMIRNHIKPALGHRKVKNLAPDHVQYFYEQKLDAGFASGTVRLMHGILHKALEQAVKWGIIPRNVCKAMTPPKPNPEEIHPLDAEQAKRILEVACGNRLEALYVLAVTAGFRIGELLGLKWEDMDLDAETLHVRRTKSQAKSGPTFTTPKSGKGRSIRLTQRAVEALKSHKAVQNAERLKLGYLWENNDLVFCTTAGKLLDFRNVATASFKPLLKKAGLPDIRFHDLRHTCATLLLSRGHHPKLVQELMGHASVAMTLDRYSHVLPGMGEQTAAAMEAALS
ncbi:MAG: site-specific integrase [Actinomycetota bacterium]|nr:site-specific integrase [Actinomycetota bacterium]